MTTSINYFLAFIIFFPVCAAYGQNNEISGSLSGSTTVYANQVSDPQKQQTVIMANGAFTPSVSDATGFASSEGSNYIQLSPQQLACSFEGDLRVSGQAGAYPYASLTVEYDFTLSTPEYLSLNGMAQISQDNGTSSNVYLQEIPGGAYLCQFGQGNTHPGEQISGSYDGFVQAGSYRLLIEVGVGKDLTTAGSFEADYNAFLSAGDMLPAVPEPSIWVGVALFASFLAASTVWRSYARNRL